mgnify:FL=1
MSMKENLDYKNLKNYEPTVYLIQDLAGTQSGRPKFNIMGVQKYGKIKVCLPEFSQIVLSPGPLIFKYKKSES